MKRLSNIVIVFVSCCFIAFMASCKSDKQKIVDDALNDVFNETIDDAFRFDDSELSKEFDVTAEPSETTKSVGSEEIDKILDDFEEVVAIIDGYSNGRIGPIELHKATEKAHSLQNDLDDSVEEMSAEQLQRLAKITKRLTTALAELDKIFDITIDPKNI